MRPFTLDFRLKSSQGYTQTALWEKMRNYPLNLNLPSMKSERLQQFRQEAYQLLGKAKDATFELMDAVLLTRSVYSFAELSLSPVFRRRWPSLYEALEDCRPRRNKLMKLYIKQIATEKRLILAGDHTPWSRVEAVTLKDRTF